MFIFATNATHCNWVWCVAQCAFPIRFLAWNATVEKILLGHWRKNTRTVLTIQSHDKTSQNQPENSSFQVKSCQVHEMSGSKVFNWSRGTTNTQIFRTIVFFKYQPVKNQCFLLLILYKLHMHRIHLHRSFFRFVKISRYKYTFHYYCY
jgi:hypothetical protein